MRSLPSISADPASRSIAGTQNGCQGTAGAADDASMAFSLEVCECPHSVSHNRTNECYERTGWIAMIGRVLALVALVVALAQTRCLPLWRGTMTPAPTSTEVIVTATPSGTPERSESTQPAIATVNPTAPAPGRGGAPGEPSSTPDRTRAARPTATRSVAPTAEGTSDARETLPASTTTPTATNRVWWPTSTPSPGAPKESEEPYPAPSTNTPVPSVRATMDPYPGPTETSIPPTKTSVPPTNTSVPPPHATSDPYPDPPATSVPMSYP